MKHRQATKTTHYHYTAHRLDSVTYDDAISTVYHYDQYGRVDSLYDESGVMCYEYGNMGEITRETRIYALPFLSQPIAISTGFEYDSWGRILNITYPDNEIVSYDYDLGGQLFRMYNVQLTMYNYLDSIKYDKFGAKISQKYGNGIKTDYTYDNITRRLSSIQTTDNNTTLSSINYTYDLVGNVTQVTSICPWLQNQSFTETFSYDSTDQLISANEAQSYRLTVNYGNWGKIMQYDLTQTNVLNNTNESKNYTNTYATQNNLPTTQTLFALYQQTGSEDVSLTYGINGSLRKREVQTPNPHIEYYLFNSQGNLKAYSDDIMSFAYYGYNAANTRTYKLSLYNTNLWINGQQQPLNMQLQNALFYPNTYLNFNQNGEYTKHYYNGMERIASRLGDNTTTIALNNNILEDRKLSLEEHFRVDIHKLIYETVPIDMPPFIDVNTLQPTGTPNDIYYYHPNHLGNTAFVTDQNQTITQGFLYAPFGEITTEYNVNFGNNVIPKYSFNAKELDEETGMYYYEARYYKPPVFTSRDPLFEKYPTFSPYTYCANNPVKYVDPTGCENVIYIIDLQQGKNKAIDTERLRNNVNAILQNRGLETRMEFLPEGVTADNFDPNKLDATDSYVVIGSYKQIKKFAEKKDENLLKAIKQENFTGRANNPEVSVNGGYMCKTPGKGIAIDAQGAKDFAKSKKMNLIYFASLSVLHGAGHNAGFNHSAANPYYESPSRYGQDMKNCAIMATGSIVDRNGIKIKYMDKSLNSLYIERMKQLFGTKKSSVNYQK